MDDTTGQKQTDDDLAQLDDIDFKELERAVAGEITEALPLEEAAGAEGENAVVEGQSATPEEEQPAVSVSSDGLMASYIPPRIRTKPLTMERLQHLIAQAGIVYGLDADMIAHILDGSATGTAIPIAYGEPAIPGRDAEITFTFDMKVKPGEILDDGSINFRERETVINVTAGQILATKIRASIGRPGRDVLGRVLHAEDGKDRELLAGQQVKVEADEEGERFYARVDGSAVLKGNTLNVLALHRISGDVDFSVGNIDFVGDVIITGSINVGFSVKAGGTINIMGSVEGNTTITAGGDIQVGKGITGRGITVTAGGTVMAKFVQDATVVAKQDVIVGSYIFNASIRAGGRVVCHGRGLVGAQRRSAGAIAGGYIFATVGIETHSLGSEYTKATRVVVGIDQDTLEQLDKLQKGIAFCEMNLLKIVRTLGIENLSVENVKRLLGKTPKVRMEQILTLVKKASELQKIRGKLMTERVALEGRMEESIRDVTIQVHHAVFQGVEVGIGRANFKVPATVMNAQFFIDPETHSITWTAGRRG